MTSLPISLSEILSVFATLKLHLPASTNSCLSPPFSSDPAPVPKNKHLKLLNGVALLLVTEGTSDVAAATVTNHAKDDKIITKFYVVKNRQCTAKEHAYYQGFIKTLNDQSMGYSTRVQTLMSLILANCQEKILTRLLKIQQVLKDFKGTIKPWGEPNGMMEPDIIFFLKKVYKPSNPDASWSEYLEDLFTKGLDPEEFTKTSDGKALWLACVFVSKPSFLSSLSSPKVVSCLRQLGDYVATLMSINKQVELWRGKRVFELDIGSLDCIFFDSLSTNSVLASISPKNHPCLDFAPYHPCQPVC